MTFIALADWHASVFYNLRPLQIIGRQSEGSIIRGFVNQKWVPYSQRHLFNAIPDTNHNANPTNPNRYSKGNPNPILTLPTLPTLLTLLTLILDIGLSNLRIIDTLSRYIVDVFVTVPTVTDGSYSLSQCSCGN